MAINLSGSAFYDSLIEMVGFKCGVVLDRCALVDLLKKLGLEDRAGYQEDQWLRIHSTEYEEIVYALLEAFGRLEPGFSRFPTIRMFHKYKDDKKLHRTYMGVMSMLTEWMEAESSRSLKQVKNP